MSKARGAVSLTSVPTDGGFNAKPSMGCAKARTGLSEAVAVTVRSETKVR